MSQSLPAPDDWTLEGRTKFVEEYRDRIVLIIEHAAENLGDETVSKVFGAIVRIPEEVIKRFLVPELDPSKLPCTDIGVFSELDFWIKHKTGGRAGAKRRATNAFLEVEEVEGVGDVNYEPIEKICETLIELNSKVDADLVGFWLEANKRLRVKLGTNFDSSGADRIEQTSNTQKSRYKADACFRFNYLYLKLGNAREIKDQNALNDYETKYFKKGSNLPQYVFKGVEPESHHTKHEIRKFIMRLFELLASMHEDLDELDRRLLKPAVKKALLDVYEFDEKMKVSGLKAFSLLKNKEVTA